MSDDWPGEWESGREKMLDEADAMPDNDNGVSFTNDHGTLYMVGDAAEGEWMYFDSDKPQHELST